jgi:hypothetical protein
MDLAEKSRDACLTSLSVSAFLFFQTFLLQKNKLECSSQINIFRLALYWWVRPETVTLTMAQLATLLKYALNCL